MRRYSVCLVVLLGVLLLTSLAIAQMEEDVPCEVATNCIIREEPPSDQTVAVWWADSAGRVGLSGKCDTFDIFDWVVTYDTDTPGWEGAPLSRYRYYGADWSAVSTTDDPEALVIDNVLPGITICLSQWFSEDDVYGSYLWLTVEP